MRHATFPLSALAAILLLPAAASGDPPNAAAANSAAASPTAANPDPAPILDYYPKAALAAQTPGTATISCRRDAHNALQACGLISESPAGQGFGEAALAIAAHAAPNPYAQLSDADQRALQSYDIHFQARPPAIWPNLLAPQPTDAQHYQWRAVATPAQIAAAQPHTSAAAHYEGLAVVRCWATPAGDLADCSVMQETPPGLGFAEAALALTPSYRLWPATSDGKAVGGARVTLPFRFTPSPDPRYAAPPTPAETAALRDVMHAYPDAARRAGVQGEATLKCGRDAQMRPTGCQVQWERPAGQGFGQAALALAAKTPPNTATTVEAKLEDYLTYKFCLKPPSITPNTLLPRHLILSPAVDRTPTDADIARVYPPEALAAHVGGRVYMRCLVGVDGALGDCVVWNQSPDGKGFGAAALSLVPSYHATPKTIDNQTQPGAPLGLDILFGDKPPYPLPPVLAPIESLCAHADPLNG